MIDALGLDERREVARASEHRRAPPSHRFGRRRIGVEEPDREQAIRGRLLEPPGDASAHLARSHDDGAARRGAARAQPLRLEGEHDAGQRRCTRLQQPGAKQQAGSGVARAQQQAEGQRAHRGYGHRSGGQAEAVEHDQPQPGGVGAANAHRDHGEQREHDQGEQPLRAGGPGDRARERADERQEVDGRKGPGEGDQPPLESRRAPARRACGELELAGASSVVVSTVVP